MRAFTLTLGAMLAGGGSLAASFAWMTFAECARLLRGPFCQAPCATPSVSQVCSPIGPVFWTYVAVTGAILLVLGAVLKSKDEVTAEALAEIGRSAQ